MKLGKLKVKLDKPYYVAGEVVTGVIYLSNIAPILVRRANPVCSYHGDRPPPHTFPPRAIGP